MHCPDELYEQIVTQITLECWSAELPARLQT